MTPINIFNTNFNKFLIRRIGKFQGLLIPRSNALLVQVQDEEHTLNKGYYAVKDTNLSVKEVAFTWLNG